MSCEELLKKIAASKNVEEIDALKEEIAQRYGIYVVMQNIGICENCGKTEDLRLGLCFTCAKKLGKI
jgi:hypothetical protein